MSTIPARIYSAGGERLEERALRGDPVTGRPPREIRRAVYRQSGMLCARGADDPLPRAPAYLTEVYRYRHTTPDGWHIYVDERVTPEQLNAILADCYLPALRAQLADSVIWRSSSEGAAPLTEETLLAAIEQVSEEAGGVRAARSNRGAFVRAVEAEMRQVAEGMAREAGGHLDEDGVFWPDAQTVCGDDEPFPF